MSASASIVTPQDQGRPLCVVGEHITLLAASEAAGGHEIFLQAGPAGTGPVPHSHPWDESFYVTLGEVHFGIDCDLLVALPGTLVHLPAGTTHWFRWGAGGGAMVSITSGRVASKMFTEIDREIPADHQDVDKLIAICTRHGLTASA